MNDKAQLHTLEGVAAATIMLIIIIYVMDATSITPLTSSTASVHVETDLLAIGQDILNVLDYAETGYNSKLKHDIIQWDGNEYVWNGTSYVEEGNTQNLLANNLTQLMSTILVGEGIAHNVDITYLVNNGTSYGSKRMIYNGDASNNAVIVSRKIVLHDCDLNSTQYTGPISDIDSTNLYNIVDIKLTLWRM